MNEWTDTDLAIDFQCSKQETDYTNHLERIGNIYLNKTSINSKEAAKIIQRENGEYITIQFNIKDKQNIKKIFIKEFKKLVMQSQKNKNILIIGLGNENITADSLGPKTIKKIIPTRHIINDTKLKYKDFTSISLFYPNVEGETGIKSSIIMNAVLNEIKPDCLIIIDSLITNNINNLCNCIQISNTMLNKKSHRKVIEKTTNIKSVISIGMPTVVSFSLTSSPKKYTFLQGENNKIMVSPKDIDFYINECSSIISESINEGINPFNSLL